MVVEAGRLNYAFEAQSGAEYAVFFEANSGGGTILVKDSITGAQLASVSDLAGGPGLATQVTSNFSRAGTLFLEMIGGMPDTTRFRFFIYTVNRAPESRTARFAIGDTVTGESIDPIPDVDDFLTAGRVGQYLAGWIEPLGPPATSPALTMQVVDPPSSNQLGYTYGVVGQTPRQLFSAGPLPNDRDYRFTVPAPRQPGMGGYTGPYRFHAYEIDPAPESVSGALPANTIVTESIDPAGDIDDFTFPADSGEEFNVFLQSGATRIMSAAVIGSIQTTYGDPTTVPGDTGMFQHATGRFQTLKDSTYRVRVRSQLVSDAVGSYRLYLYHINRAPESEPAAVVIGDTISGESIDLPGDIDEFTIAGTAGAQVNVFVQSANASYEGVVLSLFNPNGQLMHRINARGPSASLYSQGTGRFTLPMTGSYRLRVEGAAGSYRFFVYPVNPQPETHPATIAFRDSIENESIDVPGDIDEFSFTAPESSVVVLFFEAQGVSGGVERSIVRVGTGEQIQIDGYYGTFTVGPGAHILRLQSPAYPDVGAGSYRLWMYPMKPTPETVSETIMIGDTVDGEQLDPPGDVDIFYFNGVKGQHVNFAFQGTSAPSSNGGYTALLYQPMSIMGWVSTPTSSPSLGAQQTTRLDLPATGRYMIRIQGGSSPTQRIEHGPYRFALTAVDTMPEQAGTALVPGDSVTTESIDTRGDWDQYTVTATPNEDLGLIFTSSGSGGAYPWIVASTPSTGDTLARTVGQFTRFAGPFRVPSSGQAKVAVYEPAWRFYECYDATCGNVFMFTGTYRFSIIRVNRAPETAAPTYVVGDTARDSIGVGDVDEYAAAASAGATLTAYIRATAPPVPAGNGLTLEIINPVTGDTLAGKGVQVFGQSQLVPVGSFSVPAGGAFLIRVRGSGYFGDEIITAPYEMVVKP